jgi:DnaJ-domain-containing protein 1
MGSDAFDNLISENEDMMQGEKERYENLMKEED